ncbi:MAG: xylulokinase [Chloroflexi bacterium]|jgi:xylulokinase|uniref:Xylulose kinase n=1 Tax=Candidatus Thermofonsia Clade 3 bacterium TaxID=2364212 RepID=A0A2M8QCI8_9CHLR|nr:xylulokinase [Candidatus Roseilinea sp. NK_OTU-006]PJF47519.1 MAG: xylulokinase [Candidatus Thermofonsia Clade 3 bacterium]RMG63898.1 MAG: xylulokinase [Chloroflexota bacterium]
MTLLGIDLGTTAVKALLITENGETLASATVEYPLHTPRPLWSEQDPADWWRGTSEAIRQVLAQAGASGHDVRGIGLSGQMHGLTLLDRAGNVLRPAILWNDQRTAAQCDEIVHRAGGPMRTRELVANLPATSYTAPKLLWVREHEPDVYARVAHVLLPKDYIRYKLSGEFATEVGDATGTGLLDVRHRRWSDEMLALLDIPREWLPLCLESHEPTAQVSETAARETGLAAGTPIVGGSGDQPAAAVGLGSVREGIVNVTLGTSGVVFASVERYPPVRDTAVEVFCHAVPETWFFMGVMLSAGGSLRWHRDVIALGHPQLVTRQPSPADPYDLLLQSAAEVPIGAEGLIFLPYLTGERTPHRDPLARGAFVGLTLRHTQAHLARAVVEGISFGLRDSIELMRELGLHVNEVRAAGGGARSAIWRQMLADIFQADITLVNSTEGGAFGVALLAGVGIGLWRDTREACDAVIRVTSRTSPSDDPAVLRRYDEAYAHFRELYPALKPIFAQLER